MKQKKNTSDGSLKNIKKLFVTVEIGFFTSDDVSLFKMNDSNIDIIETKIIVIDNKYLNVNYEDLKENM